MPRTKKVEDMSMKSVKIPLTDTQLRKLAKGQGVRVNPSAGCTAYDVWCKAGKCKRMERMMTKGKGFALKFDPEEMDENVEVEGGRINFKKIGRTLRSTAKAVGKFYREKVRPVVGPKIREAVKKAIEEGIPLAGEYLGAITGQPEIVAAAESPAVKRFAKRTAEKGTEKLSKLTGAFGMQSIKDMEKSKIAERAAVRAAQIMEKKGKPKAKAKKHSKYNDFTDNFTDDQFQRYANYMRTGSKTGKGSGMCGEDMGGALKMDSGLAKKIEMMEHPKILAYKAQLQDNYSTFLNPKHPAMHPTLPMADNSLPLIRQMTGKGLYAKGGGLFASTSGMGIGSPMDPALPQIDNSTYYM